MSVWWSLKNNSPTDVAQISAHDVLCAAEAFRGAVRRVQSAEEAWAVWEMLRTAEEQLRQVCDEAGKRVTDINVRGR